MDSVTHDIDPRLDKLIDEEAEQVLLGTLITYPRTLDGIPWFKPDFFAAAVHGRIFDAIKTLRLQGREFGPAVLGEFFGDDPDLPKPSGAAYIKDIAALAFSPSSIKDIAQHLLSLHYRRWVLVTGKNLVHSAVTADFYESPQKVLDAVDRMLQEARNLRTGDNFMTAAAGARAAMDVAKNPRYGIKTGFGKLDKMMGGGFKPSELITVAGRPGMGKTAMGLSLAVNAAINDKQVLFFSLEMSHTQLLQRILSRLSAQAVHSGDINDWDQVESAAERLAKLPITIDDAGGIAVAEIASRAAQFQRRNGLDIIFIDYLGMIKAADPRANKVHQIEEIAQGLKNMAKSLAVPVVDLCQLSRAVEGRDDKRPGLSDLRDSGAIEQESDVVMFVYRDEYYLRETSQGTMLRGKNVEGGALADAMALKGKAELIVAKNRQNSLGIIDLNFSGERQVFFE